MQLDDYSVEFNFHRVYIPFVSFRISVNEHLTEKSALSRDGTVRIEQHDYDTLKRFRRQGMEERNEGTPLPEQNPLYTEDQNEQKETSIAFLF